MSPAVSLSSPQGAEFPYPFERPSSTTETFVRGSLFAPLREYLPSYLGPEGWSQFLARMDAESAAVLQAGFVALAWYPFRIIATTVEALAATGKALGKESAVRDMTRLNLDHATRGIFKAIFKIGSPEFMLSRSDEVWRRYYSLGEMTPLRLSRGDAIVRLRAVPDMTSRYSLTVMHSLEAVIAKAGGHVLASEITSDLADGAPYSEFRFRWR